MRRGLVLFPKSTLAGGATAFDWWRAAAQECGLHADIAFFEDITIACGSRPEAYLAGKPLTIPDFVVMRGYNEALSLFFENSGCAVFNSWHSMMLSRDKRLTHNCLCRARIPSPETVWSTDALSYSTVSARLGGQFVVKQTDGSRGVNVFLIDNESDYGKAINKMCGASYLCQRYVKSSHGRDLRLWVVGGSVAGGVLRYSESSFLSNYSQGGKAAAVKIDDAAAALAVRASQCLGLDFAGVDILFAEDAGYCVCEVNGNAGFRTLAGIDPHTDILHRFFKHIHEKI